MLLSPNLYGQELNFKEANDFLKNLELKSYYLRDIVHLIRSISSLEKQGLFATEGVWNDEYFKDEELIKHPVTGEKISLWDVKVDLTYQRLINLKHLVDHLKATDIYNQPLQYDKMCAGSIDIAIRPEGDLYVWDGLRRSLIALLKGVRYVLISPVQHPGHYSEKECRAKEAFAFKKRNGDNEAMSREELYKSGLAFLNTKDLLTKEVLTETKIDVLKTISGTDKTLSGFAEFEDSIHKNKIEPIHLVTASRIIRASWKDDSTISSYVICGLGKYIQLLDVGALSWNINVTGEEASCDFIPKFKEYAQKHNMSVLTKNRLSNFGIETISFRIATNVIGNLSNLQQYELAEKLGFDEDAQKQLVTTNNIK